MKAIKCRRKNSEGESKKGLSKTCRDRDMTLGSHFGKKKKKIWIWRRKKNENQMKQELTHYPQGLGYKIWKFTREMIVINPWCYTIVAQCKASETGAGELVMSFSIILELFHSSSYMFVCFVCVHKHSIWFDFIMK